jgi:hypothetical protein
MRLLAASFYLLLALPILGFAFFVLAERYGTKVSYVVLAWIPVISFWLLLRFQQYLSYWPEVLFPLVVWLSLILFLFGAALTIRAYKRKQSWGNLLMATIFSSIPFALVCFIFYMAGHDPFLRNL